MSERRYDGDEVREIFSIATTVGSPDPTLPPAAEGMTLAELERIGHEAGIDPARIADAAKTLAARGTKAPVQRSLGLPVGLTRVVALPRAPSDREWEQLVSQFRTVFGAPGVATTSGGLREWSAGDVHVAVEPTEHGNQLRMSAQNGLSIALTGFGLLASGMSVLMTVVVAAAGKPEKAVVVLGMFGGMALAAFGTSLVRAPRWARERDQQIESVSAHSVRFLSKP
jgi:hypothetical protein